MVVLATARRRRLDRHARRLLRRDRLRGFVAVYRGLPYELPAGIKLYENNYVSGVPAGELPAARRKKVLDHQLRSKNDAADLVRKLELGQVHTVSEGMRERNRELIGLIPAALLITAGFTAVFIQRQSQLSNLSLTYGAIFLGALRRHHLFLRFTLPHADPYLFPLVALLASFGIVMIYRIDETLAREQAQWFVVGLACFAADDRLPARLPRPRALPLPDRHRRPGAADGCRACRASARRSTAPTWRVKLGPIAFQPAEFAKIAIVIFLASYLRDTRQVLVLGARRILGVDAAAAQALRPAAGGLGRGDAHADLHPRPRLVADVLRRVSWRCSTSPPTACPSWSIGMAMFVVGAWFVGTNVGHVHDRVEAWRHPFDPQLYDKVGGSYQVAQSLFAQADGGMLGQGFGQALIKQPDGTPLLPAPHTDLIYAVITNELGLVGACGVILVYLLIAERGFKIATAGARLVLDAAGDRPDRGDGPAGVRDRRRRDQGDPADRRDAAVRLLRRLVDPRELRPAGAAAARLRPRAEARMTVPITRLFGLFVVLFAVLIGFTSRWAIFEADALRHNPLNKREVLEAQRIHRGSIKAADGTVLARSIPQRGGVFTRRYPTDNLFSHVIGYSYTNIGQAGLERARNDELTGQRDEISSVVDQLRGKQREGDDVLTTLDPKAQRVALAALRAAPNGKGAVVAIDPTTGAIKVMASTPDYNPNVLRSRGAFARLNLDKNAPVFNRATQASDPPGSTMKVVTAIAAIDSGSYTPDSLISGQNDKKISGVPLRNDAGASYGQITLTKALTFSVNTVFGEVGAKLGNKTMGDYMTRLGFYSKPPLDYPASQRLASGEYDHGNLLAPESSKIDVGRMAIGQDKLSVTPLQMAMVAAAVANKGKLMKPHFTDKVVDRDGRTVTDVKPEVMAQVMSPDTAQKVGIMMTHVVEEGTGTAGALSGIRVAGKTGTAETDTVHNITQPWFIAFAPVDNPKIAIAVTVERTVGGFGGTVAAPIAKQVLEALIR